MPSSYDITSFVVSIISLVSLQKLLALLASRLPPGHLQAVKTELAELHELLENIERERYPNGTDVLYQFQSRLQQ